MRRFGICVILILAVTGVAFVVFLKVTGPPMGYIDIKFDGISPSGVYWMVENRSSQSIYLQGTGDKIWPALPVTTCLAPDFSSQGSDPLYLADGWPSTIKISPAGKFRFNVETSLPSKYKGGYCHVRLPLMGGTFVDSEDFTPN